MLSPLRHCLNSQRLCYRTLSRALLSYRRDWDSKRTNEKGHIGHSDALWVAFGEEGGYLGLQFEHQ